VRDARERLQDILDAIGHIERYAARGREAFEADELLQNWFVRHLQIIGEAARPKFPRVVGASTGISMGAERGAEALLATNEHSVIVGRAAVEEWVW